MSRVDLIVSLDPTGSIRVKRLASRFAELIGASADSRYASEYACAARSVGSSGLERCHGAGSVCGIVRGAPSQASHD